MVKLGRKKKENVSKEEPVQEGTNDCESQIEEKISSNRVNTILESIEKLQENLDQTLELQSELGNDLETVEDLNSRISQNIGKVIEKLKGLSDVTNSLSENLHDSKVNEQLLQTSNALLKLLSVLDKSRNLNDQANFHIRNAKENSSEALSLTDFIKEGINKQSEVIDNFYLGKKICGTTKLPDKDSYNIEIEELIKKREKFHVVLIDLNNFKEINDQFGYLTGDHVLAEFARRIRTQLGFDKNKVFRWGGDEFVVLSFEEPVTLLRKVFNLFRLSKEEFIESSVVNGDKDSTHRFKIEFSSAMGYFDTENCNYEDFFNKLNEYLINGKSNGKCCPVLEEIYRQYDERGGSDMNNLIRDSFFKVFNKGLGEKIELDFNSKGNGNSE